MAACLEGDSTLVARLAGEYVAVEFMQVCLLRQLVSQVSPLRPLAWQKGLLSRLSGRCVC